MPSLWRSELEDWYTYTRFWYSKAAGENPTIGRLYHHLAFLAQPFTLQQLSLYTKSLTCVTPFEKGCTITRNDYIYSEKGVFVTVTSIAAMFQYGIINDEKQSQ